MNSQSTGSRRAGIGLGLHNERGVGYFDIIVIMMVVFSLIFCFVSLIPTFIVKQNLDYMTESLARVIEITGGCGGEYQDELARLKEQTGLKPEVILNGEFKNNKLQLRDKFELTLTGYVSIEIIKPTFAPPIEIKIPVSKTVTGISEVYWKW